MAHKYYGTVLTSLIIHIAVVLCEETRKEPHPVEDYIEIFRGIPALFEYLLDVLTQRPQVLEMNKLTPFQYPAIRYSEQNERKREANFNQDYDKEEFDQHNVLMRYKKDVSDYTTEVQEYGNRVVIGEKDNKRFAKRQVADTMMNNIATVKKSSKSKPNFFDKISKAIEEKKKTKGDAFDDRIVRSIDWSTFSLDPEEVEKYALKVEQAIEDNNKKQKDK